MMLAVVHYSIVSLLFGLFGIGLCKFFKTFCFFGENNSGIVHHFFYLEEFCLAGFYIKSSPNDLAFLPVFFFICSSKRSFYCFDNSLAWNSSCFLKFPKHSVSYFKIKHTELC